MNEEIRKIINDLEFCSGALDYMLPPDYCELLFNYITNLQQENQQLKLTNRALSGCLKIDKEKIDYYVDRCEQLDEIREQLKLERKIALSLNEQYTLSVIDKLLDKVGKE